MDVDPPQGGSWQWILCGTEVTISLFALRWGREPPPSTSTEHQRCCCGESEQPGVVLRVVLTEDLFWSSNSSSLARKAQLHLHFLLILKDQSISPISPIMGTFYCRTTGHFTNLFAQGKSVYTYSFFQTLYVLTFFPIPGYKCSGFLQLLLSLSLFFSLHIFLYSLHILLYFMFAALLH